MADGEHPRDEGERTHRGSGEERRGEGGGDAWTAGSSGRAGEAGATGRDPGRPGGARTGEEGGGGRSRSGGAGGGSTFTDGVRQGLGVLGAFRDALEETIREAREREELNPDRAKEFVRTAMGRARDAAGEARERLDFVPQKEFDRLKASVDELRVRLENMESRTAQSPDVGPSRPAGPDRSAGSTDTEA